MAFTVWQYVLGDSLMLSHAMLKTTLDVGMALILYLETRKEAQKG